MNEIVKSLYRVFSTNLMCFKQWVPYCSQYKSVIYLFKDAKTLADSKFVHRILNSLDVLQTFPHKQYEENFVYSSNNGGKLGYS